MVSEYAHLQISYVRRAEYRRPSIEEHAILHEPKALKGILGGGEVEGDSSFLAPAFYELAKRLLINIRYGLA